MSIELCVELDSSGTDPNLQDMEAISILFGEKRNEEPRLISVHTITPETSLQKLILDRITSFVYQNYRNNVSVFNFFFNIII
jgi:hypothetical protein